jgi:hypothetical protein
VSSRWLLLGMVLGLQSMQVMAAEEELPSAELLEFLGSFETAQGEWIDPSDFEVPLPDKVQVESGGKQDE